MLPPFLVYILQSEPSVCKQIAHIVVNKTIHLWFLMHLHASRYHILGTLAYLVGGDHEVKVHGQSLWIPYPALPVVLVHVQ